MIISFCSGNLFSIFSLIKENVDAHNFKSKINYDVTCLKKNYYVNLYMPNDFYITHENKMTVHGQKLLETEQKKLEELKHYYTINTLGTSKIE